MDISSFVFLSLGPVGPRGGGMYSIIEDVVCQAYVLRTGQIVDMSHSQMLGKVESGGGPIFKVVQEC